MTSKCSELIHIFPILARFGIKLFNVSQCIGNFIYQIQELLVRFEKIILISLNFQLYIS